MTPTVFYIVIRNKEQCASVYLHDIFIIQRYWNNLTYHKELQTNNAAETVH